VHVVRDIGRASDEQLAGIEEAVSQMLDSFEEFMGGHLVEALCLWREAARRQQKRRPAEGRDPAVARLRPKQAS
jgi:hypothetical protein